MDRYERVTISLPAAEAHELSSVARENGIPVSALVRHAITRMLAEGVISLGAVHAFRKRNAHSKQAEVA